MLVNSVVNFTPYSRAFISFLHLLIYLFMSLRPICFRSSANIVNHRPTCFRLSLFSDPSISHGSVAALLRCDEIFTNDFIADLPLNPPVKEFRKSVGIWRSYRQNYSVMFFLTHRVYGFNLSVLYSVVGRA